MRILLYSDTPYAKTGFSRVVRELHAIFTEAGHDVDILGISHFDDHRGKWNVIPSLTVKDILGGNNDVYHVEKLLKVVQHGYDVLVTIQDHFIIMPFAKELRSVCDSKGVKWIGYWPIDSEISKGWADTIASSHVPVFLTKHGRSEFHKHRDEPGTVIYHGTDTDTFYPIAQDERRAFRAKAFPSAEGKKLLVAVNRNQPRKNIPELFEAYGKIVKERDDVFLYVHMDLVDMGHKLIDLAIWHEMPQGSWMHRSRPVDDATLNLIYNAADLFVSTAVGEGWGLTVTEAMAAGAPILVPDNTSMTEIVAGHRYRNTHMVNLGMGDFDRRRPAGGFYEALSRTLDDPDIHRYRDENMAFVTTHTWAETAPKWLSLL